MPTNVLIFLSVDWLVDVTTQLHTICRESFDTCTELVIQYNTIHEIEQHFHLCFRAAAQLNLRSIYAVLHTISPFPYQQVDAALFSIPFLNLCLCNSSNLKHDPHFEQTSCFHFHTQCSRNNSWRNSNEQCLYSIQLVANTTGVSMRY